MDAQTFDRLIAEGGDHPCRRTVLRVLSAALLGALLPARAARAQRPDRDQDGLFDDDETDVYGTLPDVFDSDGDGAGDGQEIYNRDQGLGGNTNPLVNENAAPPAPACTAGQTDCGGFCTDLSVDHGNCGACGHSCPPGYQCVAGTCTQYCAPGLTSCNSVCVDTTSDASNCGACGVSCPAGATCTIGACECRSVLTSCNGACLDTTNDEDNCGACGKKCGTRTNGARLSCTNGLCALGF